MKKYNALLMCALTCCVLSGCSHKHFKNASPDPYADLNVSVVIPSSDKPADMFIIDAPGAYHLAGTRLCKDTGIDIHASGVTIDLMGHSLIGPGKESGETYGIRTNNYKNIKVCNGTIRDFGDRGIVDRGKKQPTGFKQIINVSLINNGKCGICIGGPANLIKECTCVNNGASGICPGYRSIIKDNLCYANAHVGIHAGRGCNITKNNVAENGQSGIIAYCGSLVADNCIYMNNESKEPDHAGIIAMDGCLIRDNVLRDNQINNVFVKGSGNTIKDNTITAKNYPGNAFLSLSKDNSFVDNQTYGNVNILMEREPEE